MDSHMSAVIYILVILFGTSSWLSTNAIWMELSLLTQSLPEGWSLPSYLAAVIQVACIGPLVYSLLHKCTDITIPKAPTILVLLISCSACTLLLAFGWDWTAYIFGVERSVALIGITFLLALVNATSNVLFMPYMATFHPNYLTAYFVGMGLSALVPSLVSLLQGTLVYECVPDSSGSLQPKYSPARFHVEEFSLIMFGWMCLATVSFIILHWFIPTRRRNATSSNTLPAAEPNLEESSPLQNGILSSPTADSPEAIKASNVRYWVLIVCLAVVCAQMNSVIPSVQSYASLSYSLLTYHLALSLANLMHPVACFIPLWLKPKSLNVLTSLTALTTFFCGLIVVLALQSPTPLLRHSVWGSAISIVAAIIAASLNSYLRTVLTSVVREDSPQNESRLFWCGVVMQAGSFLGACLMFPLVNVFNIFHSANLC
uniref:Riboflavin transporter n=1 Tax=Ditylenchus dipsaci TaxID=166011 RepID=A0A915DQY1_9BILA